MQWMWHLHLHHHQKLKSESLKKKIQNSSETSQGAWRCEPHSVMRHSESPFICPITEGAGISTHTQTLTTRNLVCLWNSFLQCCWFTALYCILPTSRQQEWLESWDLCSRHLDDSERPAESFEQRYMASCTLVYRYQYWVLVPILGLSTLLYSTNL